MNLLHEGTYRTYSRLGLAIGLLMMAVGVGRVSAESINPATVPQTAPMTEQGQKNLDFVLNWWREVIYGGHLDLAPKYQAEDYMQHNPNVSTGRTAFVAFFSRFRHPINPMPDKLERPPVAMGAKGDFVWLVFEDEQKDPRDPSRTYHANSIEVLRLQNGKVQEHWDDSMKRPGSGIVVHDSAAKPPSQWNAGKVSKDERKTLAVAKSYVEGTAQFAPAYVEHDPNGSQSSDMERPGQPALTLVNGPYCLMMWERTTKDPDDSSSEYKWSLFHVIRVENGLIQEHWDQARLRMPKANATK